MTPDQLKDAECGECHGLDPDCNSPLVLAGLCHPKAGSRVVYLKGKHALDISCHQCGKQIVVIRFEAVS